MLHRKRTQRVSLSQNCHVRANANVEQGEERPDFCPACDQFNEQTLQLRRHRSKVIRQGNRFRVPYVKEGCYQRSRANIRARRQDYHVKCKVCHKARVHPRRLLQFRNHVITRRPERFPILSKAYRSNQQDGYRYFGDGYQAGLPVYRGRQCQ